MPLEEGEEIEQIEQVDEGTFFLGVRVQKLRMFVVWWSGVGAGGHKSGYFPGTGASF